MTDTQKPSANDPILTAALACARRRWYVRQPEGAEPDLVADKPPSGSRDATIDLATIMQWYRKSGSDQVQIQTGKLSNLLALDYDLWRGGDALISRLQKKHGRLPTTIKIRKNHRPGRIFLFAYPSCCRAKCRLPSVELGRAVVLRGDDDTFIAPPSGNAETDQSEWVEGLSPDEVTLAPCPDWLIRMAYLRSKQHHDAEYHAAHRMSLRMNRIDLSTMPPQQRYNLSEKGRARRRRWLRRNRNRWICHYRSWWEDHIEKIVRSGTGDEARKYGCLKGWRYVRHIRSGRIWESGPDATTIYVDIERYERWQKEWVEDRRSRERENRQGSDGYE